MKHCRDCKHWDLEFAEARKYRRIPDEVPEAVQQIGRHRICAAIELVDYVSPEVEPLAFTNDASGYQADLWTKPEFGCVLFEARRDSDD